MARNGALEIWITPVQTLVHLQDQEDCAGNPQRGDEQAGDHGSIERSEEAETDEMTMSQRTSTTSNGMETEVVRPR
jgi:hypothetical protein